MVTVNERVGVPQAHVINGVDAGGAMTAVITEGYENLIYSEPDGLQIPIKDREIQFCRGVIATQDWIHIAELLTGTLGTYVFYERKSGVAAATGYIQHTITNPVIHTASITLTKGGYAQCSFSFECKADDEAKGFADMHALLDDQAAPTDLTAARGGYRIETAVHGADPGLSIYHVMGLNFAITMPLVKACNDADIGYTCVDARLSGLRASGSISFQDAVIAAATLKCQALLAAARASLVVVVTQSGGAADKTITIAGVTYNTAGENSNVNAPFTEYSAEFDVSNDPALPLTLAGDNKIITIA